VYELREHERVLVAECDDHKENVEATMSDYDLARFISKNSLAFIERRRWRLVETARDYLIAEDVRRQSYCGITQESYDAWRAFVSELGF
jgi:hypothetical protein